ncbi:LOW QUALITY PROTEIN: wax ester synthase/diacylglycerol acyltransferase 4-like [Prosopis cineraria]|uniref:LOW QUALITY PROTEIN: wax ester synthase/diacylglycerol acyltransferase 4-like n=1 Tax=Prosopis cineraria TaxID=364024 RepID=UPI002410AF07|nr:LOW QUALITY PROTEIN: wax ester synthase/diacylglycerol acyltransferase 4-like [Prosopis cineraria]
MADQQWRMTNQHQEEDNDEEAVPVSPVGQYFNSSALCIYIIGVLEFQVPLDESQAIPLLQRLFLPINPRFSSIMVEDSSGDKRWKKVDVNLKDHVNIPLFPEFNSMKPYDKYFTDYLSRIAIEKLPENRPLWEIHVVNYPTSGAASSLIFKLHHALGDGYSLMGALLSCLQRADDPSLPLSFPSLKPSKSANKNFFSTFSLVMSSAYNTVVDFYWSMLKSTIIEDDKTPIRSGFEGTEVRPLTISTMTFSIDQIKLIKSRLGVTINDVITGIIFYGTRLYMQDINKKSSSANSTALVLLKTRNTEGYQSIDEMLNSKAKGPWGNRISFLHVPIPKLEHDRISNPLEFIWEAHNIIKRKKKIFSVPITGILLEMEGKFRGHEAVAKHIHGTLSKSSTVITNLIGPTQPMSLANHPVKGLYFTLAGGPESLVISVMSYMGVLRVTLKAEKYFIDEHKLNSRIKCAFETIFDAALEFSQQAKT